MPPNRGQAVLTHTPNILIQIQFPKAGMEIMTINFSVAKNILLKITTFLAKLAPLMPRPLVRRLVELYQRTIWVKMGS